jgi:hypothetical protein
MKIVVFDYPLFYLTLRLRCSKWLTAVLQSDPHVLGLADPDRLGRGMDPDPSSCKNCKKNLDSYYFVTLFDFLSLKSDANVEKLINLILKKLFFDCQ